MSVCNSFIIIVTYNNVRACVRARAYVCVLLKLPVLYKDFKYLIMP